MGLAFGIARRSLLQRPGRTLFSVLGIALGIATVVGIFTLDHNTVLGRSLNVERGWQAEISIRSPERGGNPRQELAEKPGVKDVVAAFQNDVRVITLGGSDAQPVRSHLIALDSEFAPSLGAYALAEGRDLVPDDSEAEVLMGAEFAESLGLAIGDSIMLSAPKRSPRKACIGGEWEVVGREPQPPARMGFVIVGTLEDQGIGHHAKGQVVIVDYDHGKELYRDRNVSTIYYANRDETVDVERTDASLAKAYSYEMNKDVLIGQAADERAFRNGVRFAGLLALVLGLYVIFHTLSMSLIERMREVGTLSALGCSRGQIGRVFFTEAATLAGLGGLLGLGGGLLLARVLLKKGVTTIGVGSPIHVFQVPWEIVGPLVLLGVGIALLGSVYPLLKATSTNTAAAMRGESAQDDKNMRRGFSLFTALLLALVLPVVFFAIVPVLGESKQELTYVLLLGVGVISLFLCLPLVVPALVGGICTLLVRPLAWLWPLSGQMAAVSMRQGARRVSGAVAGIALVIASFVGLHGMTDSLTSEVDTWGQEAFVDKVFVRDMPRRPFEEVSAQLHRYPGVVGVEPADVRQYVPHLLLGVRLDEIAEYGPVAEDPSLMRQLQEGGVILCPRLAAHIEKGIGDEIHVDTAQKTVESRPVVAISDAYGYFPWPDERLYAVMSDQYLSDWFCIDTDVVSSLVVRMEPGADHEVVRTAMYELYPDAQGMKVNTGADVYHWHIRDIGTDFRLFDLILALTLALAGLGVLNGQLLAALERARETGVLKALGTTRRQVAGMVLIESGVVGLLGGILGVTLGAVLIPVIVDALVEISSLPIQVPNVLRLAPHGILGAFGLAILAAVYPIWRTNRLDAVAAVRAPG